jgi:hypothetical protein
MPRAPSFATMIRRLVPVLVAVLAFGFGAEGAAAHTLSKRAALKKTGSVARKAAAAEQGAAFWFAGACRRRSVHKVACWGGVAYVDGTGCIQKVVVGYTSHRSRSLRARRTGRVLCGDLPSDAQGEGGTGGGGGSPVVCAIRQSVCI